jgi:hypothetical protein
MLTQTITLADLQQFFGTENYYANTILGKRFLNTDGVQFLADATGSFWLIDVIASHQTAAKVRRESFQLWQIAKKGKGATVTMRADTNAPVLARQHFARTGFPFDSLGSTFEFYVIDGSADGINPAKILMLKSEY